jgi:hypothetical protein
VGEKVESHQAVAFAGLGEREEGVLDLDHGAEQVLLHRASALRWAAGQYPVGEQKEKQRRRRKIGPDLELNLRILGQVGEVYAAPEEHGGGLRHSVDLPAEVFEEGGEPGLASGLPPARTPGQDKLPYLPLLLLRLGQ